MLCLGSSSNSRSVSSGVISAVEQLKSAVLNSNVFNTIALRFGWRGADRDLPAGRLRSPAKSSRLVPHLLGLIEKFLIHIVVEVPAHTSSFCQLTDHLQRNDGRANWCGLRNATALVCVHRDDLLHIAISDRRNPQASIKGGKY